MCYSSRIGRAHHKDRAKIIDVGERRSRDHRIAERFEKSMSVIVGEALARTYILRPRALERVRRDNRAGDLFLSVDAVGVAGNRINAFAPFERNRQRQQKFDVAPPRPLPRTVTVVSPPDNSTHGGAIGCPCATTCWVIP